MNWPRNWRCWLRHRWVTRVVGIPVQDDPLRPLTVAFKECYRCGASKWLFVYSNLPEKD